MTNAVITQTIYNSPHTAAGFADAIASAWVGGGLGTLFDSFTEANSNIHRVLQTNWNNSVTKGSSFLDIYSKYDGNYPNQRPLLSILYDGFNATTHAGTNASGFLGAPTQTSNWFSFVSGQQITLTTINHPELKYIYITQGSLNYNYNFGVFRPINIPSWWSENSHLYAFMSNPGLLSFYPLGWNPLSAITQASVLSTTGLTSANNITNKRDIFAGLILTHPANQGIIAKSSDDLVLVAASGMNFGDVVVITSGTEEYTLITPGGTPGVAIRTV